MSDGAITKSLNRLAPRRGKQKISPRPVSYELVGMAVRQTAQHLEYQ